MYRTIYVSLNHEVHDYCDSTLYDTTYVILGGADKQILDTPVHRHHALL